MTSRLAGIGVSHGYTVLMRAIPRTGGPTGLPGRAMWGEDYFVSKKAFQAAAYAQAGDRAGPWPAGCYGYPKSPRARLDDRDRWWNNFPG